MATIHLIVGLGKTGLSVAHYLIQQGLPVAIADNRLEPPGLAEFRQQYPTVPVYLGEFAEALFCSAKEIIVSPGLSTAIPALEKARAAQVPIIGDIELFMRVAKAPVIGITGTNAKGTVTTLIGEMLHAAGKQVLVGGNIGTPALALLAEAVPDYYVLELSSFQLETTYSLQLTAATILNISEDHLDRHGDLPHYIAAKQRIYKHCTWAIYNRDDAATLPMLTVPQQLNFGLSKPGPDEFGILTISGETWLSQFEQPLLRVSELRIKGTHNWANVLAALALGTALGLPLAPMLSAVRNFKGLAHRCEWVLEHNAIAWYNDSKGTNVGSTMAAIQGIGHTLKGKIVLIAGGLGKGADFTPLREPIMQFARQVILFGQDAQAIAAALNYAVPITYVKNLPEAVLFAEQIAQPQDAVLLSPACASWDMFRDYAERGELFRGLVQAIAN